jgi:hypothetical protein
MENAGILISRKFAPTMRFITIHFTDWAFF